MGFIKSDFGSYFFIVDFKIIIITHLAEGCVLYLLDQPEFILK